MSSSSFSSSSAVGDLGDFQGVRSLRGISGVGSFVCGLRGIGFPLSSCFSLSSPWLYTDFRADFASGSSRFLADLTSSASLPPPSSVAPSVSLVSLPPQAPVPFSTSSLASSPPLPPFLAPSLTSLSSAVSSSSLPPALRAPPVSSTSSFSLSSWYAVSGGSGVAPRFDAVPVSLPVATPVSAPLLFRPFAADPAPSVPVPAALLPSALMVYPGPSSSASPPFLLDPSFVAPDELLEDAALDALPRDEDLAVPAVIPDSVWSEFRRMLSFLKISFCRLRVLLLLLLLLVLFSKISLAPLLLLLLLSSYPGLRGSARPFRMLILALPLFFLRVVPIFLFSLLATLLMPFGVSFLIDLFPQVASAPSAPPPPHALFEDFFGSSAPTSSLVFLAWLERVRTALSDADSLLASFLSSGCADFSFLPPRNSSYAVRGEFASGQAAPVNPLLLFLFEKQLKPSSMLAFWCVRLQLWRRLSGLSLRPYPIPCGSCLGCWVSCGSRILL